MVPPEILREAIWPTWILTIVLGAAIMAQAFVRVLGGIRTVVDDKSGIRVPWVQIGWLAFTWFFLLVAMWPMVDVLLRTEWTFSELLVIAITTVLLFFIAAAISPDATYQGADGEERYLEIAPIFFGLIAAVEVWLLVQDAFFGEATNTVRVAATVVVIVLSLILAFSKNMSFHKIGSILIWAIGLLLVIGLLMVRSSAANWRRFRAGSWQSGWRALHCQSYSSSCSRCR